MRPFRKSRRPGNRPPTKAQQAYHDQARALGCVVCRFRIEHGMQPNQQAGATEIHHRTLGDLRGQVRLGQDEVVALCEWHHEGDWVHWGWGDDEMREVYGPSFKYTKDFREWTADVLPHLPGKGTERWQAYQDELLEPSA